VLNDELLKNPDFSKPLGIASPTGAGKTAIALSYAVSLLVKGLVKRVFIAGPLDVTKLNFMKEVAMINLRHGERLRKRYGLARFITAVVFSKEHACQLAKEQTQGISREALYEFCAAHRAAGTCPYFNHYRELTHDGKGVAVRTLARLEGKSLLVAEKGLLTRVVPVALARKLERVVISAQEIDGGACPYYLVKNLLQHVQMVILDFNYLLNFYIRRAVLQPEGKSLLEDAVVVFDEATQIEKRAREGYDRVLPLRTVEAASAELDGDFIPKRAKRLKRSFDRLLSQADLHHAEAKKFVDSVKQHIIDDLHRRYRSILKENRRNYRLKAEEKAEALVTSLAEFIHNIDLTKLDNAVSLGMDIRAFRVKHHIGVRSHVLTIARFLRDVSSFKSDLLRYYVADYTDKKDKIHIAVGRFAVSAVPAVSPILRGAKHTVFVSATLLKDWFRATLAISDMNLVHVKSPFDVGNRLDEVLAKHYITKRFRGDKRKMQGLASDAAKLLEAAKVPVGILATHTLWAELKPHLEGLSKRDFDEEPMAVTVAERREWFTRAKRKADGNANVAFIIHPWGALSLSWDVSWLQYWICLGIPYAKRSLRGDERVRYLMRVFKGDWVSAFMFQYTLPALERSLHGSGRAQRFLRDRVTIVWVDERYGMEYIARLFKDAHPAGIRMVRRNTADAVRDIVSFARHIRSRLHQHGEVSLAEPQRLGRSQEPRRDIPSSRFGQGGMKWI
jgi:Rad3-related DNA helicase